MKDRFDRRTFLAGSVALAGLGLGAVSRESEAAQVRGESSTKAANGSPLFQISLAQWSLHRSHFGKAIQQSWDQIAAVFRDDPRSMLQGDLDPLDFPKVARSLDIGGLEYVNTFFFDRARDQAWLDELAKRCEGEGVRSLLIMCDNEGALGDPDSKRRKQAVDNHRKWLDAAAFLGCHSIRVNAESRGSWDEQRDLAAEGLQSLCEIADDQGLNVLVENHGGLSSNGQWLSAVMKKVDHPRIGTLPDFGNFQVSASEIYDHYQGVEELMPFAKSVSAKSYDFDSEGNETKIDFTRMMKIVLDAGYGFWVGIEYEGTRLPEQEGIARTRDLLRRVRDQLGPRYA